MLSPSIDWYVPSEYDRNRRNNMYSTNKNRIEISTKKISLLDSVIPPFVMADAMANNASKLNQASVAVNPEMIQTTFAH